MKTLPTLAAILLAATSTAAFAAPTAQEFVTKASVAGMFEVETSNVALTHSSDADVKAFAKQMVTDHTAAGNTLKTIAAKEGLKPATALDSNHQEKLDELKTASKDDFNDTYISLQEDAHDDAVSLFGDYAKNGDNAALKQFAAKTLPTLEKHKAHIEKLDDMR